MRGIEGEQVLLRLILSESRTHDGKPLYRKIVEILRGEGFAGATVLKGVAGFGHDRRMHTAAIEVAAEGLPVVVEVVDTPERIDRVLPKLEALMAGGVIMTERAHDIRYAKSVAPPPGAPRAGSPPALVANHADLLHGDEPAAHHPVHLRQHAFEMRLRVHDLDDEREVGREPEEARLVDDRIGPEAGDAPQHRRAGQALRAEQLEQRHGERAPLPAIRLADEDPHEHLLAFDPSHGYPRSERRTLPTPMPRKQRLRQIVVVTMTLIQAWCQALTSISRTVS